MRRSSVLLASSFVGVLAIIVFSQATLTKTLESQTQVLFLHTEFFPYHDVQENCRPHLLGRELIRQAVLLAARDELGVPTFDETLRETLPENVKVIHLFLRERASPDGQWHMSLYAYDEEGGIVLRSHSGKKKLLKSGDASEERLEQLEKMLTDIEEITRSAFAYFVGRELDELGKSEEAEKYWRRAMILPNYDLYYATLAGNALAEHHGTSRPDDDRLDKGDLWPARSDKGRPRAE